MPVRRESQALVEMMNNLQPSSRKILLKTQRKLMEKEGLNWKTQLHQMKSKSSKLKMTNRMTWTLKWQSIVQPITQRKIAKLLMVPWNWILKTSFRNHEAYMMLGQVLTEKLPLIQCPQNGENMELLGTGCYHCGHYRSHVQKATLLSVGCQQVQVPL